MTKSRLVLFLLFLVSILAKSSQAAPAINPPAAAGISPAVSLPGLNRVGIVAGVKGIVQMTTPGQVGRVAGSGEPVFLGDTVSTDAQGHLQILLLDETVFTIGPNSAIVIDQFIYDPATQNGEVKAKVIKGVFRFVTGKIARKKPSQMEVDLPSGTIGIRGTIVGGKITGARSLVLLLGPGEKNNTPHRQGSFVLRNRVGAQLRQIKVTRPGYGSIIEGEGAEPTPPFRVPEQEIREMTNALQPGQADDPSTQNQNATNQNGEDEAFEDESESATEQAGQDTATAGADANDSLALNNESQLLNDLSDQASQDSAESVGNIQDGITTLEQLRLITTGIFHFASSGSVGSFIQTRKLGAATNIQGKLDAFIDIDFGARTIGGGNSRVVVDTLPNGGNIQHTEFLNDPKSFASGSGPAIFGDQGCSGGGCNVNAVVALLNHNGVIAADAVMALGYSDTSGNAGDGAAVLERKDGPTP